MRKKKKYVILTFATTTAAMAMEKQCGIRQIPGRLIPLPGEISAGCGLAWRMLPEEYEEFQTQLEETGQKFQQIVELEL
ncbi:MAG: DUF3343 domain-containing protein [Coprococcus sp.]